MKNQRPTAEQRKLRQLKACVRKIVRALTKEA